MYNRLPQRSLKPKRSSTVSHHRAAEKSPPTCRHDITSDLYWFGKSIPVLCQQRRRSWWSCKRGSASSPSFRSQPTSVVDVLPSTRATKRAINLVVKHFAACQSMRSLRRVAARRRSDKSPEEDAFLEYLHLLGAFGWRFQVGTPVVIIERPI